MYCEVDTCANSRPCELHYEYEVPSCPTIYSGFNDDAREKCDKSLHAHIHEHFRNWRSHQDGYRYTGPLFIFDEPEYWCYDEYCCICGQEIDDPDNFVFNLVCSHSYHKYCIHSALRNGYSDICIGCDPSICKPCIGCSY